MPFVANAAGARMSEQRRKAMVESDTDFAAVP
jgi:hypothetical protein